MLWLANQANPQPPLIGPEELTQVKGAPGGGGINNNNNNNNNINIYPLFLLGEKPGTFGRVFPFHFN